MNNKELLYIAQDELLDFVFSNATRMGLDNIILAGGTALARCYLNHRISYDLDFFNPGGFSEDKIMAMFSKGGITLRDIVSGDKEFSHHLKATAEIGDQLVEIDFVEDIFDGMFDTVSIDNDIKCKTETIEGLYHRKVRTISGVFDKNGHSKGSRQTARDLFDLHLLSKEALPLSDFILNSNNHGANIPDDMFKSNILHISWIDLVDEFESIIQIDTNISYREIRQELEEQALSLVQSTRFKRG